MHDAEAQTIDDASVHKVQVQTIEASMGNPSSPLVNDANVQIFVSSTEIEDIPALKARLSELIAQNDDLTKQIDELKLAAANKEAAQDEERTREKDILLEEIGSLTSKVKHLQELNENLSVKVNETEAELVKAAEHDGERLTSLQNEVDNLKQQNKSLKHDLNELSSRSHYAASGAKDRKDEKEEMVQEITSLRDHIQTLEEYNDELSQQLVELQDACASISSKEREVVAEEIKSLQNQILVLKQDNEELSTKLAKCWIDAAAASQINNQILLLQQALKEKDIQLQSSQKALTDHSQQHHTELDALKSQITRLQETTGSSHEEMSLLQIDLQNALNECEEKDMDLATVNMEFTNALNSLESLQKENQRLKQEIQSLSSIATVPQRVSPDDDNAAYYEKEITMAHSRFVSMEKSLKDRIERLEGEKYRLIAAHNDQMEKKEIEFERVRVELSAWKLEMQNALNDIEGVKREKNELELEVAIYKATLDALGKAEAEGDSESI